MNRSFASASLHRMLGVVMAGLFAASGAQALSIAFDSSTLSTAPGGSVTFTGRIQNDTFFVLNTSTDLFHNFSSYDPAALSPLDLLPTQNVSIAMGTLSPGLLLFHVDVAPTAALGVYLMQASLQDIYGSADSDVSPVYDLAVNVVPEPASGLLLLIGIPLIGAALRARTAGGREWRPARPSPLRRASS